MKQVEVSVKGLFFYILKHWIMIVVAMLLGALILGGAQYYNDRSASHQSNDTTTFELELSDAEKEYVESVYHTVTNLSLARESQSDSILAYLDYKNVYNADLIYFIKTIDPECLDGIEQAYRSLLNSAECTTYISGETGINESDIRETVTLIDADDESVISSTAALSIHIVSDDKDKIETVIRAIDKYINSKRSDIHLTGIEYELMNLNCGISFGEDVEVYESQLHLLQEQQTITKTINDAENSLKDAQKNYYNFLVNSDGKSVDMLNDDSANDNSSHFVKISTRKIAMGLFIGAFLMCGILFLIYVFSNRLDEEDDVETVFGTYYIGKITGKEYGNILYKLRNLGKRTFGYDESVSLICSKIKTLALKNNISRIALAGCGIKMNREKVALDISTNLKAEGIEIIIVDDPLYNPTSFNMLSEVNQVVIIEKAGITYRNEIWDEISMINRAAIKLYGMIMVE